MDLTIKERLRLELDKIKAMDNPQKREYIWEYYKLHIIGTIVVLFVVGSIVNDTIINPPPRSALTIAWMAGFEFDEQFEALREALIPYVIDEEANETVQILNFFLSGDPQHDMAQHTRFSAMTTAQELDIIIGNFVYDAENGVTSLSMAPAWSFGDLRPILAEAGVEVDVSDILIFEEEDAIPVAFAVPMENSSVFADLGISTENRYLGVLINTRRNEAVINAITALWANQ